MRVLFIGDVVGKPGRRMLTRHLDSLVDQHRVDFIVANAENAAGGFGVTPEIVSELLDLGIHCLTSGNHIWDKKEAYDLLDEQPALLRPLNYPAACPGGGVYVGQTAAGLQVAVLNVMGRVFMPPCDDPFRRVDEALSLLDPEIRLIIVDCHGEATSEKVAMGWHLDGRVSMVLGTHTHVPTADERILPGGTAYQSDVGMTGPYQSVIGVMAEDVLKRFLTGMPTRFRTAKRGAELHAALVTVDEKSGRATDIQRLQVVEED
ncbi:MAG: TIGR00282 family metallophosphoesterase [Acidobacteria bacterium]|nr:TIGR00282 family metallophosphoesterase [Acidobacteriota bacterium]